MTDAKRLPVIYVPIFDGLPDGFIARDGYDQFTAYSRPIASYNNARDVGLGDAKFFAFEHIEHCSTCANFCQGIRTDVHLVRENEPRDMHGLCAVKDATTGETLGFQQVPNDGSGYCWRHQPTDPSH